MPGLTPPIPAPRCASRTRQLILNAAQALLAGQSYDVLAMDAVAGAAGVTRRTLYNQFASKAELYHASRTALLLELSEAVFRATPAAVAGPAELCAFATRLLAVLGAPASLEIRLSIIRDGAQHPWLVADYQRHVRAPLARSSEMFLLQLLPGRRADSGAARIVAEQFLTIIEALAAAPALLGGGVAVAPGQVARHVEILVRTCLARPAPPPPARLAAPIEAAA